MGTRWWVDNAGHHPQIEQSSAINALLINELLLDFSGDSPTTGGCS